MRSLASRTSRCIRPALMVLVAQAAFHVRADTIELVPAKNGTIYAPLLGQLVSNGAGNYMFAGNTAAPPPNGDIRRAVLAFDVAGHVSAGATITSVNLTLHMSKTISGAETCELHATTANWGEGTSHAPGEEGGGAPPTPDDVTWNHRFYPDTLWAQNGGDFSPMVSASTAVADVGFYTWSSTPQLVADVQGWLDHPAGNFGWVLVGNEAAPATAKRFDSRHNATPENRPKLTIIYTTLPLPIITSQPQSQSVCAGQPVTFTVAADRATSFQWQRNGANVSGATAASYSISAVAAGDAGSYTVVVGNASGSVTSTPATLTVLGVPVITGQPSSLTVDAGGAAVFTVTATGATGFQWQKNGSDIAGATEATFTLNPVQAADAANYAVVVSNACGQVTSAVAPLTVPGAPPPPPPPPPPSPPVITTQPQSQTVCAGSAVTFSVAETGATAFQWNKSGVPVAGVSTASFSIATVGPSDAGEYTVVASNAGGTVASDSAQLTVGVVPAIGTTLTDQQANTGDPVSFTVSATNATAYQWRKDGTPIPDAILPTYQIASAVAADDGDYDVVVSNACGSVTSNVGTLLVVGAGPAGRLAPQVNCGAGSCGAGVFPSLPLTLAGLGYLKERRGRRVENRRPSA
jgi:hypothetical protein